VRVRRYQGQYKVPRTATVGRMQDKARAELETRWLAAIKNPTQWWLDQLAAAATATNRSIEQVVDGWGL
jgi:hypothetical protein